MSRELSEEMLAALRKHAARSTLQDKQLLPDGADVCAADYAGGNFDDAWAGGEEDGATWLAREVLADLGEE